MSILKRVIESAGKQIISNAGFEAGKNGQPPNVTFQTDLARETYNEAYRLGQEAANTKLASAVTKKIE